MLLSTDVEPNAEEMAANVKEVFTDLREMLANGVPTDRAGRVTVSHAANVIACEVIGDTTNGADPEYDKAVYHLNAAEDILDNLNPASLEITE